MRLEPVIRRNSVFNRTFILSVFKHKSECLSRHGWKEGGKREILSESKIKPRLPEDCEVLILAEKTVWIKSDIDSMFRRVYTASQNQRQDEEENMNMGQRRWSLSRSETANQMNEESSRIVSGETKSSG
jgi:hypothetical protein